MIDHIFNSCNYKFFFFVFEYVYNVYLDYYSDRFCERTISTVDNKKKKKLENHPYHYLMRESIFIGDAPPQTEVNLKLIEV